MLLPIAFNLIQNSHHGPPQHLCVMAPLKNENNLNNTARMDKRNISTQSPKLLHLTEQPWQINDNIKITF
jgi:hypothetical protein